MTQVITYKALMVNTKYSNLQKKEIYKTVYNNSSVYIEWLDEIKRVGIDNDGRVRNPMCEGGLIYTNLNGLYSVLWNACVAVLQGNYNFTNIPRPTEVYYDNKLFNYLQNLKAIDRQRNGLPFV
jgi:hypothetical protein